MITKTDLSEITAATRELDEQTVPEIVIDFRLTLAVANFWDHYSHCPACHCEQTALCPVGNSLNEFASKVRDEINSLSPETPNPLNEN